MEADEILNMLEDSFHHGCFTIDVIVRNDDSTMWAALNNKSRGAQGKVLKSSKGKCNEKIPVLSLLAHTSHHMKVVAKHVFDIMNYVKEQRCGCTKADAL